MFIFRYARLINQTLIRTFDRSPILYCFLLFPAYQIVTLLGVAIVWWFGEAATENLILAPIAVGLGLFVGVFVFASWHLSFLLVASGYFTFLAWLGLPFMSWAKGQLDGPVNWFRSEKKLAD